MNGLVPHHRRFRPDSAVVRRLRADTTPTIRRRLRAALGPLPDAGAAQRLEDLYAGALLNAGFGYSDQYYGARSAEQVVQRILNRR